MSASAIPYELQINLYGKSLRENTGCRQAPSPTKEQYRFAKNKGFSSRRGSVEDGGEVEICITTPHPPQKRSPFPSEPKGKAKITIYICITKTGGVTIYLYSYIVGAIHESTEKI